MHIQALLPVSTGRFRKLVRQRQKKYNDIKKNCGHALRSPLCPVPHLPFYVGVCKYLNVQIRVTQGKLACHIEWSMSGPLKINGK